MTAKSLLKKFVLEYKNGKKGNECANVKINGEYYEIPEDKYEKFLKLYGNVIEEGGKMRIIEKHKEWGPIVMEIELVYEKNEEKNKYTGRITKEIVSRYMRYIGEYLEVDAEDYDCYVMEKSESSSIERTEEEGIKIMFPYVLTNPALQHVILDDVIQDAKREKIFENISLKKSYEDTFKESVIYEDGWPLYGSYENESDNVYEVTHIYNNRKRGIELKLYEKENKKTIHELIKLLRCRRYKKGEKINNLKERIDPTDIDKRLEEKGKNHLETQKVSKKLEPENDGKTEPKTNGSIYSEDFILEILTKCLSQDKMEDWLKELERVGSGLKNSGYSKNIFMRWLKKVMPKAEYDEERCKNMWDSYKLDEDNKMTIRMILKIAKEKNTSGYKKILETYKSENVDKFNKVITNIFYEGPSDTYIASLYHENYRDNFMYDEINDSWYIKNNYNIWTEDKKGNKIMVDIGVNVCELLGKKYESMIKELTKKMKGKEGYEKETLILKSEQLNKNYGRILKYLRSSTNKKHCLEELKGMVEESKIYEKMDEVNGYLFAFKNGVYDLRRNEFRLPYPEEYISRTVEYEYREKDKKIRKKIKKLRKLIGTMFNGKDEVKCILREIAQCLVGKQYREEFYIWRGAGRNGKGIIRDLIMGTYGFYYDSFEIEYLNKTKHGQSATSADEVIASKKLCRIIFSSEPSSDIKLKMEKIKQWSGRDPIQCRHLYGKLFNYKPKFKLFLMSNYDIEIEGASSQAVKTRLKSRWFPFSFVSDPEGEYQKQEDVNMKNDISENKDDIYSISFFHLLKDIFNEWVNDEYKIEYPRTFIEETSQFLLNSDIIGAFFERCVKINPGGKIRTKELFDEYCNFTEKTDSTNIREFLAAMESKQIRRKNIKGYSYFIGIELKNKKKSGANELIF